MGKITNTCGHNDANGSHFVAIKYFDREGKRSISYRTVCSSCLINHDALGELLHTGEDELNWILRKPTCMVCEEPATWERCTQFAGNHPYCEKHAIRESDFGIDDQDTYWKQL
jgi:hypothetical protein